MEWRKADSALHLAQAGVEPAMAAVEAARLDVSAASELSIETVQPDDLPDAVKARQEYHPHESSWLMTLPLVLLALLAMAGGGAQSALHQGSTFPGALARAVSVPQRGVLGSECWLQVGACGGCGCGRPCGIAAAVAIYLKGRGELEPGRAADPRQGMALRRGRFRLHGWPRPQGIRSGGLVRRGSYRRHG